MQVKISAEYDEVESEYGNPIDGYLITCSRCGHSVQVAGVTDASIKRGAIMLRDECPNGENNFYK